MTKLTTLITVLGYVLTALDRAPDAALEDPTVIDTLDQICEYDLVEEPTLEIDFAYPFVSEGYYSFSAANAVQGLHMGYLQFLPSSGVMTVENFTLTPFAIDTIGLYDYSDRFEWYQDGGVRFVDHFTECHLVKFGTLDIVTNATVSLTAITFEPFEVSYPDNWQFTITCDHNGMAPVGDHDGFSVDMGSPAYLTTVNGGTVTVTFGDYNGQHKPTYARVLLP